MCDVGVFGVSIRSSGKTITAFYVWPHMRYAEELAWVCPGTGRVSLMIIMYIYNIYTV